MKINGELNIFRVESSTKGDSTAQASAEVACRPHTDKFVKNHIYITFNI